MTITKPPFGWVADKNNSLTSGLLGSWLLNEGTGLVAKDSSGSGNDGAFGGTNTPTWTTGDFGAAVAFTGANGVTSYISLLGIASLPAPYTIMISIRPALIDNTNLRLASANGNDRGTFFFPGSANPEIYAGSAVQSSVTCNTSTTYTMIGVFTSAGTGSSINVNGTINTGDAGTNAAAQHSYLGGNTGGGFSGYMNFAAIWSRTLSTDEQAALIANPFSFFKAPIKPSYGTMVNKSLSISQGIDEFYLLNEGTGTSVGDSSGNGHTASFGGTNTPTWTIGKYGPGVAFIDNGTGYITPVPTHAMSANMAIMIAFTPSKVFPAASRSVFTSNNGVYYSVAINVPPTYWDFQGGYTFSTTSLGSQVHIITCNTDVFNYWINGSHVGINMSPGHFSHGSPIIGAFANNSLGMVVDCVGIWTRDISASEIATLTANPFAPYTNNPPVFFKII